LQYWKAVVPEDVPYAMGTEKFKTQPFLGSAVNSQNFHDAQLEFVSADDKVSFLNRSIGRNNAVMKFDNKQQVFGKILIIVKQKV